MAPVRASWSIRMKHESGTKSGYGMFSIGINQKFRKPPGRLTRIMEKLIKPPRRLTDLEDFSRGTCTLVWSYTPFLLPLGVTDLETSIVRLLTDDGHFPPALSRSIALDILPFFVRDCVSGSGGSITEEFNVHVDLELIFEPRECIAGRVHHGLEEPLLQSV